MKKKLMIQGGGILIALALAWFFLKGLVPGVIGFGIGWGLASVNNYINEGN